MTGIIDFHTHIFPEKIAQKASQNIGDFYGIPMGYVGTFEVLQSKGVGHGISAFVAHAVATRPDQVVPVNDFLSDEIKKQKGKLFGFGSLHPDFEEWESELERIKTGGFSGVKFHPDFQQFNIDDRALYGIYEAAQGVLPIMFHTGDDRYDYSSPIRLSNVLRDFPGLEVIAAHFGGYLRWDNAEEYLVPHKNCSIDCSSSFQFLGREKSKFLIRKFGAERVLFGSDFPMWNPMDELAVLQSLGLSPEELSLITIENAKRLLRIE